MGNKKNEIRKQATATPQAHNDQLGENATDKNSVNYYNKGSKATEKRS